MGSTGPFLPLIAIVMVAVLTFLYTVAKELESRIRVNELKLEVKHLQDKFAKRRAAVEAGATAGVLELEEGLAASDEIVVLEDGMGDSSMPQAAA